jgi:hypothetical protein
MKKFFCANCGSGEFTLIDGYYICNYCKSKFIPEAEDIPPINTEIALDDDVRRLLNLIKTNPENAKKYIKLILDIDPSNEEVRKYL